MSLDVDRSQGLEGFGYTPRQAQFLLLVALHGGYFLRRQYMAFTGRSHGLAVVRFLATAVAHEHVRALPYGRHGRVFHLCARPIYAAIGDEHNRNRRAAEWDAVTRKLMTVDFVLAHPTARFWATEVDKVVLLRERGIPEDVGPARHYVPRRKGYRSTTRYFVDKMPWYQVETDPRLWFAYIDAERTLRGFKTFLSQYRPLLSSIPSGVTYVAPRVWRGAIEPVFRNTLGLGPSKTLITDEVLNFFQLRREIEADRLGPLTLAQLNYFRDHRPRFSTPALQALYTRWRERQDRSLSSTEVNEAACPDCVLHVHALGHTYLPDRATTELAGDQAKVT